ncbi:MAG TPA: hypothetical protein DD427_06380, partial [Klebsiella pneumoniae]|nr:hypothetical protein [Klebsiella pneumoniae]
TAYWLYR